MLTKTNKLFQLKQGLAGKGLVQASLGLFALNQYCRKRFETSNECGGILAHVVKKNASEGENKTQGSGVMFQKTYSEILRKNPYYQCGIALNDLKTNTVRTAKFSSIGKLASGSAVVDDTEQPANKEEAKDGSGDEDSSSNEDEKKNEVLRQPDYGYQERA